MGWFTGSFFTLARCSSNRCQRRAVAFLEEDNARREKLLHHREHLTKWPWSLCPHRAPAESNDALMGYCHGVVNQPLSLRAQTLNVKWIPFQRNVNLSGWEIQSLGENMFFFLFAQSGWFSLSAPVYESLQFMLQLFKINVASEVKHAWAHSVYFSDKLNEPPVLLYTGFESI